MKAINNYISEKLHLRRDKVSSDEQYINKWVEIIKKHYSDWVREYEAKHSAKRSTDDVIQKDIEANIQWLKDHCGKPELYETNIVPRKFIEYLKEKEII